MKDPERLETLKALAQRLSDEYVDDPNVLGVGWGMARRGGELRPEMSLVFFVRQKADADALAALGTRAIPERIDDYPTDVVVRRPVSRAQMAGSRNDDLYDPLRGGVASANLEQMDRTFFWSEGSVGTLGILCRDADGREMALSNWHVWADNGAENGDRIVQPGTPEGGGYAEGVAKTVLCGPAISSFFEGRLPSGLAAGLYAGAAAAALAAALSDKKDPFRRGQDATPDANNAITHRESLAVGLQYDETPPWPGKAFPTEVKWAYTRHTNQGLMKSQADEKRENPQVLRGYAVAPDRAIYEAGDTIVVSASLWDHQFRPDDAYHVVAHLVSATDPDRHLRLVLHPVECRGLNLVPSAKHEHNTPRAVRRASSGVCLDFRFYAVDQVFDRAYNFGPIAAAYYDGDGPLRMGDMLDLSGPGLLVPERGVVLRHAPATEVVVRLAHDTEKPVRVTAFDSFDRKLAEATAPADRNVVHSLRLEGEMITHVRVEGGENRLLVFEYCFDPVEATAQAPASGGGPAAIAESALARTGEGSAIRTFARVAVRPMIGLGRLQCEGFDVYKAGTTFPPVHQFGEIEITALDKNLQRIVGWPDTEPNSLLFSGRGIAVVHEPADRVVLRVGHFTSEDIVIRAFAADGNLQQEVIKSSSNSVEVIQLAGNGIVRVSITGGRDEGILVRYCFERGKDGGDGDRSSFLRCFRGAMPLPPDVPLGRWIVYLGVQNLNHVPDGVPPEQAATVIGGHVMGPTAEVLGCGFMLLGDHVFDIF